MNAVRLLCPRLPPIAKDVWNVLLLSLEARCTMHITYTDGRYASNTWRDVDPYNLIMRDRRWLLVAHCQRTERATWLEAIHFHRTRPVRSPALQIRP